jgi:protein phosphatase
MVGARERQEDDFAARDLSDEQKQRFLFVVADGMGGHQGAAAVAQLSVRRFCEIVQASAGPLPQRLRPALLGANESIALAGVQDTSLAGAGCALLSATVEDEALSWISVGDCSLLLFRRGKLRQLNEDHSMRAVLRKMVTAGRLSASAAAQDPRRAMLRSSLRGAKIRLIDVSPEPLPLIPGDAVILASDGLETLSSRAIGRILRRAAALNPPGIVDRLLSAIRSLRARQQDNVTIVCYRFGHERRGTKRGRKLGWAICLLILAPVVFLATVYGLKALFP